MFDYLSKSPCLVGLMDRIGSAFTYSTTRYVNGGNLYVLVRQRAPPTQSRQIGSTPDHFYFTSPPVLDDLLPLLGAGRSESHFGLFLDTFHIGHPAIFGFILSRRGCIGQIDSKYSS